MDQPLWLSHGIHYRPQSWKPYANHDSNPSGPENPLDMCTCAQDPGELEEWDLSITRLCGVYSSLSFSVSCSHMYMLLS